MTNTEGRGLVIGRGIGFRFANLLVYGKCIHNKQMAIAPPPQVQQNNVWNASIGLVAITCLVSFTPDLSCAMIMVLACSRIYDVASKTTVRAFKALQVVFSHV